MEGHFDEKPEGVLTGVTIPSSPHHVAFGTPPVVTNLMTSPAVLGCFWLAKENRKPRVYAAFWRSLLDLGTFPT